MTLLEEIRTCPPELLASRDTQAIADHLSAHRTRIVPTPIGVGTVMATIPDGARKLRKLEALGAQDDDCYWAVDMLRRGTLDMGNATTRRQLGDDSPLVGDDLSQATVCFTHEDAKALLALAEQPATVSEWDVRCACWSADGEWMP